MNAGLWTRADDVLRCRVASASVDDWRRSLIQLFAFCLFFGAAYGAVMGCFGWRPLQVAYSAVKVPILLLVTLGISLPSFFVINTLLGLRADFSRVVQALLASQAGVAIVLASLAPYTALWYASVENYQTAPLFSGGMFAISSLAGQWILRTYYRPLIARERRHRSMFWLWLGIYVFVGIQMAWTLRPFVGDPALPVEFFREETWGNAYVKIFETIARLLR